MTNEERCKCTYNETGCSDCEWTRLIQENTKLKAEIEQLKENYGILARQYSNVENSSIKYYNELKQLKAELEQSVKSPCKVGSTVYLLSNPINVTDVEEDYDEDKIELYECTFSSFTKYLDGNIQIRLTHNGKFVGWYLTPEHFDKVIFLTREEAEQSLKGQV